MAVTHEVRLSIKVLESARRRHPAYWPPHALKIEQRDRVCVTTRLVITKQKRKKTTQKIKQCAYS